MYTCWWGESFQKVYSVCTLVNAWQLLMTPNTPGNLDCLNKMLNREKVNGSFRLRQSRAFEAKQVRGKHRNIHIIEIIIPVTKIEECYSAADRLRKIFIAKYLPKISFLSRNRVSCWLVLLLLVICWDNRDSQACLSQMFSSEINITQRYTTCTLNQSTNNLVISLFYIYNYPHHYFFNRSLSVHMSEATIAPMTNTRNAAPR